MGMHVKLVSTVLTSDRQSFEECLFDKLCPSVDEVPTMFDFPPVVVNLLTFAFEVGSSHLVLSRGHPRLASTTASGTTKERYTYGW